MENDEVNLEVLSGGEEVNLQELVKSTGPQINLSNKPSNTNMAIKLASLAKDPEEFEAKYNNAEEALGTQGETDFIEGELQQLSEGNYSQSVDAVRHFISTDASDPEKQEAVQGLLNMNKPNIDVEVGYKLLSEDDPGESPRAEASRMNLTDIIEQMQDVKQKQQRIINATAADTDTDGLSVTMDFLEFVTPFVEGTQAGKLNQELNDGSFWGGLALTGSSRKAIFDKIESTPLDQREAMFQEVADIITETSNVTFVNDNDFLKVAQLRHFLDADDYTDTQMVLDNIFSVFDLVSFGLSSKVRKGVSSVFGRATKIKNTARPYNPTSMADSFKEFNKSRAIDSHVAMVLDESGEVAEVVYGTERSNALVHDLAHNPATPDGVIDNHIHINQEVRDLVDADGQIQYTDAERVSAVTNVTNDFKNADGVTHRGEMSVIESAENGGVNFRVVVGPEQGGWGNAEDALETVKVAFRARGVDDSQIVLYKRTEKGYEPTTLAEVNAKSKLGKAVAKAKDKVVTVSRKVKPTPEMRATWSAKRKQIIEDYKVKTMAGISQRLSRGDRKQLNKELSDLEYRANRVTDEAVGKKEQRKDLPARQAKKEAVQRAKTITKEERDSLKVRIEGIKTKLANSKLGEEAEANMSRVEQDIIPPELELVIKEEGKKHFDIYEDVEEVVGQIGVEGLEKADQVGDYLVGVNYNYKVRPNDVDNFDHLDVKRNWADKFKHLQGKARGSFARHIADAHSMLHQRLTLSANQAVDKSSAVNKAVLELGKRFTDIYVGLKKDRQGAVEEMIRKANTDRKWFNNEELEAAGFTNKEIEALGHWRETWDTMYHLENKDLVNTLRNQGYKSLRGAEGTELFAKAVPAPKKPTNVFDPNTGEIVKLDAQQIEELYETGGTIAKTKQPIDVGDNSVDMVVSNERAGGTYLKELNDNDTVLNYIEGYYPVQYQDPYFIIKSVKDANGKVLYEKAVKTVKNSAEAKRVARGLDESGENASYHYRQDTRKTREVLSEDDWDLAVSSGRTAQRVRGKRLEDATGSANGAIEHQHIAGPVDTMISASQSISRRTSMRDWLDTAKARFAQQYGHLTVTGGFPKSIDDLSKKGREADKDIADARTTFEYIKSLENGYVNDIDDFYKVALKRLAETAGDTGTSLGKVVEGGAHRLADGQGPMQAAKSLTFHAYLGLNPARQWVVQAHQAVMLTGMFPRQVASQQLAKDFGWLASMRMNEGVAGSKIIAMGKLAGKSEAQMKEIYKAYMDSGFPSGIDQTSLVRGTIAQSATSPKYSGKKFSVSGIANKVREVGFDVGEEINLMAAWMAHYNDAMKGRGKLTQAQKDMVTAKARNFTLNMNRAGDMPYNSNNLSLIFHFLQVPHKAMTQIMFNRALTRTDRLRIGAFTAATFTLPATAMLDWFGPVLPEPGPARDLVVQGLEGVVLNKMLSSIFDEDVRIDFSSLAPVDVHGTANFVTELLSGDIGAMIAESPSAKLIYGENSKLHKLIKTTGHWLGGTINDDDEEGVKVSAVDVFKEFTKLSSGMSNMYKSIYQAKHKQNMSASGQVIDSDVGGVEASAQFFGLPTLDVAEKFWVSSDSYKKTQEFKDDVTELYKETQRLAALGDTDPESFDHQMKVLNELWKVLPTREAREIVKGLLERDIKSGNDRVVMRAMKQANYMDIEALILQIQTIPDYDESKRAMAVETLRNIQSMKNLGEE